MDQTAERSIARKDETKAFLAEQQANGLLKPHDLYDKICNIIGRKIVNIETTLHSSVNICVLGTVLAL